MADSFYDRADFIDQIVAAGVPSVGDAFALFLTVDSRPELEPYLFSRPLSAEWLPLLRQVGLLQRPPAPVQVDEGFYHLPVWQAARYLERIASERPQEVAEIAARLKTDNARVHMSLIGAALTMPGPQAARVAKAAVSWLKGRFSDMIVRDSIRLASYLAEKGEGDAALALFAALTELAPPPEKDDRGRRRFELRGATPRHDEYWVQRMLAEDVPMLAAADPWPVLTLLAKRLTEALAQDETGLDWGDPRTSSIHWRGRIDLTGAESPSPDFRDALLDALRKLLDEVAAQGTAGEVLSRYLRQEYALFRRLALYILSRHSTVYPVLVEEALGDPDLVLGLDARFEGFQLWKAACSRLSRDTREAVCAKLAAMAADSHGERVVVLWLQAARDSGLPPDTQALLDRLMAEHGEQRNEPAITFGGFVRLTSPVSGEQFAAMTVGEVADLLRQPFSDLERPYVGSDSHLLHSQIEFARVFAGDVARRPREYSGQLAPFLGGDMGPEYLYHLLAGFVAAWDQGTDLDWGPILDFCAQLLARAELDIERQRSSGGHPDIRFESVHGEIARLLEEAYKKDEHSLPDVHDGSAKRILFALLKHPDPSLESDDDSGFDAATASLNVVRGKALHALVRYALHRARTVTHPTDDGIAGSGAPKLEPDVRAALEDRLGNDPSPAVRAVFGMFFPQLCDLDRDWAVAKRDCVFERSNPALWRAAWRGFVSFSQAYQRLYPLLREHYGFAVADLATAGEQRMDSERADERLATHIATAYWLGWDDLKSDDSPVKLFFDSASPSLRGHAIAFLRSGLQNAGLNRESEEWERLKELWQSRLDAASRGGPPAPADDEMMAFTGWLQFVPENLAGLYDLVRQLLPFLGSGSRVVHATEVIEYLERQSPAYPTLATALLMEVLKTSRHSAGLSSAHIRPILEVAMTSGDNEAIERGIEAINLLGEMGRYEYRDLLAAGAARRE